jgi:hypothetical protein
MQLKLPLKFILKSLCEVDVSSFKRPLGTASLSQADACDSFRSIFILGIVGKLKPQPPKAETL